MRNWIRRWLIVLPVAQSIVFTYGFWGTQAYADNEDTTILLVGNSGSSGVEKFSLSDGKYLGSLIAPDTGGLVYPDAITTGPDGTLYVSSGCRTSSESYCDKDLSAILQYNSHTGAFLNTFASGIEPSSALYRPYGTAFGPGIQLYVASFMSNQILRYDYAGKLTDVFASQEEKDPYGLNGPNGLAFSPDRRFLYVTTEGDSLACSNWSIQEHCKPEFLGYPSLLLRYSVITGEAVVFDEPTNPTGSPEPSLGGIAFGPDGLLYASDFTTNVIRVYDPETQAQKQLLPTVGPTMCTASISNIYTGDLTFDASGSLLVAVGGASKGDPGAVLRFWGEDYSNHDCLVQPTTQLDRPIGIHVLP